MALHYNLSKIYALSDNDSEFVLQILSLFVSEVPADLAFIKKGIEEKNHQLAYSFAHKIKPTFDLLGMNLAYEEILQVEDWTKKEGKKKEIKDTFKSIETQVENVIKEINKDYNL